MSTDPLSGLKSTYRPENIFLTSSKGFDTIVPEVNIEEARLHAKKILELDGGEQWVEIYLAEGRIIERVTR